MYVLVTLSQQDPAKDPIVNVYGPYDSPAAGQKEAREMRAELSPAENNRLVTWVRKMVDVAELNRQQAEIDEWVDGIQKS